MKAWTKLKRSIGRRVALLNPEREVTRNGITYAIDAREIIDLEILRGGWEQETLDIIRAEVKPGMTVLEVGANVGAHTLELAQLVGPTGHVHAIEPTDFARGKLGRNLALNPDLATRVTVHNLLVTDANDTSPRRDVKASWSSEKGQAERPLEQVTSDTSTLDDLVQTAGIAKVDFLKIDIDGYDMKALRGAQTLLSQHRPVVFIEMCQPALLEQGDDVFAMVEMFRAHGYDGRRVENGQPMTDATVQGIAADASANGLFHPQ